MDLHAWITQQVDHVEARAKAATPGPWHVTEYSWASDFEAGVGTQPGTVDVVGHGYEGGGVERIEDARHIGANDPAAVLHRCEADRRILNRHRIDPTAANSSFEAACEGCGHEWLWDDPVPFVDNLNDCPELLDLAYAHGLTDETLASLDRPEPGEPCTRMQAAPAQTGIRGLAHVLGIKPITTSDMPAALRGPRWKP